MDFKTAIYNQILEPMYLRVYRYSEILDATRKLSLKSQNSYRKDIVEIIVDIVYIKEKYQIDYSEDLILIEKYKK